MKRKYMTLSNQREHEESPRISLESDVLVSQLLERELSEAYAKQRPVSPLTPTDVPTEHDPTANDHRHEGSVLMPMEPVSGGMEGSSGKQESLENANNHALKNRSRSVHERMGTYTLVIATISTISLLAALIFLAWMWFGDRSSPTWRRIMLHDFAKQAVTVSSIILRTAIACLGGIATGMIASISIEHRGVPFQDVAQVSIARFSNSGPDAFWISMLFRTTFIETPSRLLLILLLLFTLASQFTSTILLSDLGQGTVVAPSTRSTNTSGFSYAGAEYNNLSNDFENANSPYFTSPNYWTTDPTVFQSFAEYSEPGFPSDDVDDTGLTLRAFLPFADTTSRQSIREFQGMASVFDTRVVCTRSHITSLMIDPNYDDLIVWLMGNLTTNSSLPGLAATQSVVSFDCPHTVPFVPTNQSGPWGMTRDPGTYWSVCPLDASAGGLLPVLDPANNSSLRLTFNGSSLPLFQHEKIVANGGQWHVGDDAWNVDIGNAYLIHNGANLDSAAFNVFGTSNWSWVPSEGPWVEVNFQGSSNTGDDNPGDISPACNGDECWKTKFRMSLCYDALPMPIQYYHIQEFNITASASEARTEPSLQYNLKDRLFQTEPIRTQLGATSSKSSLTARGILNLTSAQDILAEVAYLRNFWKETSEDDPILTGEYWSLADENVFNRTTYPWMTPMIFFSLTMPLAMCPACTSFASNFTQGSTVLSTLFTDTITATNSPALALQALLTTVLRQAYYSFLPTFDAQSDVTVTSFQAVQIPLRTRGFWAVLGITSAHFVLCLVALIGFISFTRVSSLKNAWQAIADVSECPEMAEILRHVMSKSDSAVATSIEQDEVWKNRRFRIRESTDSTDE
ncbi:hypothetical protein LTR10_020825 [Elasticomyces elasticus]|uniref:Uncharacterized protein n=1 Tax=Exophiala sideris TaxID=1016849 RepID=A0ABR0JHN3_9EURO|nr:hypothetical protein LTR10_020825 [Elasticomyces elasticus]KAK5034107.1 hypothetical protein LTS07_003027 [Exophiala sideris]KAK5042403.1 hypothetical protein LTR13_001250 [Exophiala sideris]KAK5065484.1 hypothetical protein LTR69_003033 [Exophiala sideris]